MAGIDSKKQLLTLIRDCASEKSQGERRVISLKKRIEELKSDIETANAELEVSKRLKETTEQELNGYEVEFSLSAAFIHTLEARISQIQEEISAIGSEIESLKNKENAARDGFIGQMVELNTRIREFQEFIASRFQKANNTGTTAGDTLEPNNSVAMHVLGDVESKSLVDMLAHLVSQTIKLEQEYVVEQDIQKLVQQEYIDLQRKVSLVGVIMKETKALQDLTRQTSELEETCASLGDQLQKRCACPSCHTDNIESLGGILQAN